MHTEPTTAAGLLLSLASALPDPGAPIGREARRIAARLSHGGTTRDLSRRAADLTAALLDLTDVAEHVDEDDLLSSDFELL